MSRPRGATGYLLDNSLLLAAVRAVVADPGDREKITLAFSQYVLVDTDEGYGVVNTEGVGRVTDAAGCVGIDTYIDMFSPVVSVHIDEIMGTMTTQIVDLADVIRTFGQRLESNHYTWYSRVIAVSL